MHQLVCAPVCESLPAPGTMPGPVAVYTTPPERKKKLAWESLTLSPRCPNPRKPKTLRLDFLSEGLHIILLDLEFFTCIQRKPTRPRCFLNLFDSGRCMSRNRFQMEIAIVISGPRRLGILRWCPILQKTP